MLAKELEDGTDMLKVFCLCLGINKNIVKIDDYPFVENRVKDLEHHVRKGCGGVCQAERDHIKLEMAVPTTKGGLMSVRFKDPLLMVPRDQVQLGKVLGPSESIDKLIDAGKRMAVLFGDPVEGTVVDAHSQRTVGLLDK